MAFEKKKTDKDGKELAEDLSTVEEFGEQEEVESAEVTSAAMEADIVLTPVEDTSRMVKITPRLTNLPAGSSMSFSIGGKMWNIIDNKPCLVTLDVARQLEEKGYIPKKSYKTKAR